VEVLHQSAVLGRSAGQTDLSSIEASAVAKIRSRGEGCVNRGIARCDNLKLVGAAADGCSLSRQNAVELLLNVLKRRRESLRPSRRGGGELDMQLSQRLLLLALQLLLLVGE
jgi:hypothetical protein